MTAKYNLIWVAILVIAPAFPTYGIRLLPAGCNRVTSFLNSEPRTGVPKAPSIRAKTIFIYTHGVPMNGVPDDSRASISGSLDDWEASLSKVLSLWEPSSLIVVSDGTDRAIVARRIARKLVQELKTDRVVVATVNSNKN